MRTNIKPENRRLLEALDYIEDGVISSVLAEIKVPDEGRPECAKNTVGRSLKYALALAACLVLLSAVIPVVSHLIANFPAGISSDTTSGNDLPGDAEYMLTEEDLAMINAAWADRFNGASFAETVDEAMTRTRGGGHYFGKYGDTIVIWRSSDYDAVLKFAFGGYEFSFSTGNMWFFNGSKAYNQYEITESGIMTDGEIKELYSYYMNDYTNFDDSLKYTYPMFVLNLEYLTQDEMEKINEVYDAWQYEIYYNEYVSTHADCTPAEADNYARYFLGYGLHHFFNKNQYSRYQYYGKFDDCVVLAIESKNYILSSTTVAGYEFKLGAPAELIVYREGAIVTLSEAYDLGYMTKKQIGSAYERYLAYQEYLSGSQRLDLKIPEYTPPEPAEEPIFWKFMPDVEELSREQMNEIRRAFAEYAFRKDYVSNYERYPELYPENYADKAYEYAAIMAEHALNAFFSGDYYHSRCYGKIGDCVVLAIVMDTLSVTEYRLGDTVIRFSETTQMYVYRDGEIMDFWDYYKNMSMSDEDIALLSVRHQIYDVKARSSFLYLYDSYLEPIKDIEPLTREQIGDIRSAFANYTFNSVLDESKSELVDRYGKEEGQTQAMLKAGNESKAAYNLLFGKDIIASRYYGIIDGYAVFGIADSEDYVSSSVALYVYSFDYDMVFKYTSSMLSADGVAKLTVRKAEYEAYLINNDATKLLVESYFGQILYDDAHPLVFTHKTDRCMLICVKSGYEELKKYEIAGYEFIFPYGVDLYVGYNGETYSLYSAHQIGYITDADMAEIYEAYLDYYEEEK